MMAIDSVTVVVQYLFIPSLTVSLGLFTFVIGQIIVKSVIEPRQELADVLARVNRNLIYYANRYTDVDSLSSEERAELQKLFRKDSVDLLSSTMKFWRYDYWSRKGYVLNRENVEKASAELMRLSNSLDVGPDGPLARNLKNSKRRQIIADCLGFDTPEANRVYPKRHPPA